MFNISTPLQIEAQTLWDLVVADSCGCYDLYKPCKVLISDGTYGIDELPCKYACENTGTKVLYQLLLKDNDLLKETYPIFWRKQTFHAELQVILGYLYHWDPNGDWDCFDVLDTPLQTIGILEDLKEELKDNYEDIPRWIDVAIDYLMVFVQE